MSMNKKVLLCFTLFISLFLFSLKVNANCDEVYSSHPYPTEEQCQKYSEHNFKCKGNGYSGGMVSKLKCEKSDECIDGYTKQGNSCVKSNSSSNNSSGSNGSSSSSNGGSSSTGSSNNYEVNTVKCETLDKKACKLNRNCKWNGANCIDSFVASDPCNDDNIRTALRFIGYLLMIARVAIPLIIIVMATIDLFKSVIDKDEKSLSKQVKIIIMRIVAGVFVFFLPTIVYALFNLSAELKIVEEERFKGCATCLLKPKECSVDTSGNTDSTNGFADSNGNCPSGYSKGVDGICYKEGICGSYTSKDTCPSSCKWSPRNGCQSK